MKFEYLQIDPLLTFDEHECSRRTGRPVWSLRKDRKKGVGLPYLKWGASVRYRAVDCAAWLEQQVKDAAELTAEAKRQNKVRKAVASTVPGTAAHIPPHLRGRGMRGFS
jgi:hypothetical protein